MWSSYTSLSVLAYEIFVKILQIFEHCVLVNNNVCGKLVLPLKFLIKFDERLKSYISSIFYRRL